MVDEDELQTTMVDEDELQTTMVDEDELQTTIGTEDSRRYKPAKVKILEVEVRPVGEKGAKKAICHVKHPEAQETIEISSVKNINPDTDKVEVSGLWVNKDSENKLRKNSATARFMNFMNCKVLGELVNKEVETIEGATRYLVFKGY